ncbi:MAG: Rpn family recombination-promoting nuclease/putative transposase [Lachnospiraceae bacterium]|nr:Rpn family recombination-promoting nuclease/putative transposase [Lachnospiraceae bacterium]
MEVFMTTKLQLNKEEWRNAKGKIAYGMTNDYMFRMVLQSNNNVLKGIISSMMHVPLDTIDSVKIANPIELGKYIEDKDYILDIKVKLNDNSIINLEMQVADLGNWQNRSLSYLCRTFETLQKGDDYNSVMPVTHIGFLDYDLFPEEKEFYSNNMLQNVKTGTIYNSNFCLRVLSLNQIELATEEDKRWHIDEWARLFKATTWEELKMIAEKDKVYSDAANSIYEQNSDETVRMMCEARREAIFHEQYVQNKMEALENQLEEARRDAIFHKQYVQNKIDNLEKQLSQKDNMISQKDSLIEQLQAELEKYKNN